MKLKRRRMETLILNSAVLPFLRLILIPTQMYKVLCVSNKKKFLDGWVVHTTTQCSGAEPEEVKFQLGHQSHWVIAVFSQTWNFCRFNSELSSAPLMHYSDLTVRGQKKAELEERTKKKCGIFLAIAVSLLFSHVQFLSSTAVSSPECWSLELQA